MSDTPIASRPSLGRVEWGALVAAIVLGHVFYWRSVLYPSAFDASEYLTIAADLARTGLFGDYRGSQIRTYGYPLFLLGNRGVAELLRLPWTYVVFASQLALYLGAAILVRRAIAGHCEIIARIALVALVLNPFPLVYAAETLTECLSITLLLLAAGAFIATWRASGARRAVAIAAVGLAIGAAVIVRPANVFALPAWAIAATALALSQRWTIGASVRATLIAAVCLAVPMLPQLANNVRHHGAWTPLIAAPLGRDQQAWGIAYLKYATALPPVPMPSVFYLNPYAQGRPVDPLHPGDWYRKHPASGAATLALHAFGMLDQDLLFTYARDLDPWYRRPLGVLVHGALALAVVGVGLVAVRSRRDPRARVVLASLCGFACSHIALHATTAVEMRFGLPLLVLAGPLAAWALGAAWPRSGIGVRVALAAFVAAWIGGALLLSDWVRAQSAQIRAWQAEHAVSAARR